MSAYLPTSVLPILVVVASVLADLGVGAWLGRTSSGIARAVAWAKVVLSIATVHWALSSEPPGVRMLALVVVGLAGMKLVVVAQRRTDGKPPLSAMRWLWFALAWLGMRPDPFAAPRRPARNDGFELIAAGLRRAVQGLLVLGLAWALAGVIDDRVVAVPLLLGVSLVLHFGFCAVLAGIWRWWGVPVEPLFNSPARATSLTEFWGRRWNLAFSRMTQLAVYRPLGPRVGRSAALAAAFLFSGLLHEVAISLPVDAGYGGPLAYFSVQALLVLLERRARSRGYAPRGWWGRAWTIAALCLPLPLLFHEPFVRGVLFPLIGVF